MNGIRRGLQLIADFFHLFHQVVIEQGRNGEVGEFWSVMRQWLADARALSGPVGLSPLALLLSDPFQASRMAFRDLQARYASVDAEVR